MKHVGSNRHLKEHTQEKKNEKKTRSFTIVHSWFFISSLHSTITTTFLPLLANMYARLKTLKNILSQTKDFFLRYFVGWAFTSFLYKCYINELTKNSSLLFCKELIVCLVFSMCIVLVISAKLLSSWDPDQDNFTCSNLFFDVVTKYIE